MVVIDKAYNNKYDMVKLNRDTYRLDKVTQMKKIKQKIKKLENKFKNIE